MAEINSKASAGDVDQPVMPWANLAAYRGEYRARNPVPDPADVVPSLAERRQWLMWRYERKADDAPTAKPRKVPYYGNRKRRMGKQGDEKDREALLTYAEIVKAVWQKDSKGVGWDGVGFAFLPDDGLIGIDLDGMIDPESGEISERCASIISACATYTEYSPSGKGVHIIGTGQIARSVKSNDIGVEMFCGGQFFTFTGRTFGQVATVEPIDPKVLARIELTIGQAKRAHSPPGPSAADRPRPAQQHNVGGQQRSKAQTVALAEEALGHLRPDDFHVWIKIGHALKEGLADTGYLVWDEWSSRGKTYPGGTETRRRWDTFEPNEVHLGAVFAMAEEAGWVSPWAKARSRPKRAPAALPADLPPPPIEAPARGGDIPPLDESLRSPPELPEDDNWQDGLISKKGELSACLANARLILENMPAWKGVIAYDEFSERTVHRAPLPFDRTGPAEGEWSDHLDVETTIHLQRAWRIEFSTSIVPKAVESMARKYRFHPVREALKALAPWDGKRRNATWLSDYLGVERTPYTELVGAFFLRGMIQRVMRPGCKFDYCLVLEGGQGLGKSTVCRILGWHWFCDTDLDLSNKDSLLALPGHWVYEIAELGSLMKAEERKQKSFLSRQEDEFRPPYGQRLIKVPRQNVFIGTTNEEEYLKDATGGRRFWPVMCGAVFDLDGLRAALPQMYAEALADFSAGEVSFPTREQQDKLFTPEQAKRGMPEPFEDLLQTWVSQQVAPFSMAMAATDGLNLSADKLTPAVVTRLGIVLKKLGCGRKENRLAADPGQRRLYLSPAMMRKDMRGTEPAQEEVAHAYF